MSVVDLKLKEEAVILNFNITDLSVISRLQDLGLFVGSKLKLCNVAPFGDPYKVRINNFSVSLKKSIAEKIIVEQI